MFLLALPACSDGSSQPDTGFEESVDEPDGQPEYEDAGVGDDAVAGDDGMPGDDAMSGDDSAPGDDAGPGDDAVTTTYPIDDLDDVRLYINIGDSLAAGYDADGNNGSGGHGYSRLILDNHPDYPAYGQHNLTALYGSVQYRDVSDSGDTSAQARDHLENTSLPDVDGDVLVTLTCGGNDFNNDVWTMLLRARTEAAANELEQNYIAMVDLLRNKYEKPVQGHRVVFLMTNLHDPTAGTGAIPPGFDQGFCETLNNPLFTPPARQTAIDNLNFFNQRMTEIIESLGGHLVDNHGVFFDHGMNAPGAERWITDDCTHPSNEGHHQLRREEWFVLTGERY
jgi:lysophospholipase L1-like esterase